MDDTTRWYHYLAYAWGGAFLANTIPHLVAGISGSPFQSPFATPPGEGLSSATVNVVWGSFNLLVAYLLLMKVGKFDPRKLTHILPAAIAAFGMAVMLARHFDNFHGGNL